MSQARRLAILKTSFSLEDLSQLHLLGFASYVSYGGLYYLILHSRYMALSNLVFAVLTALSYRALQKRGPEFWVVHSFLALNYLGLFNIVVHIGGHDMTMLFWGLMMPLIAAFVGTFRTLIFWGVMSALFLPLSWFLKMQVFPGRIIPLDDFQQAVLYRISYLSILFLVCYFCFLFRRNVAIHLTESETRGEELSTLLRVVLHDISNPLAAVKLRIENAEDLVHKKFGDEGKRVEADFEFSLGLIDRITAIIDQIRAYWRVKSTEQVDPEARADLLNSIDEARRCLAPAIEKKGLVIEFRNSSQSALSVRFSPENLTFQVFVNLLTNAIKFSPEKGKIEIDVFDVPDSSRVQVRIRDHGIGMPASIIERLGAPTASLSRMGTAGERGLGYGSAISHAYLRKFRGSIRYESVEQVPGRSDSGTTVILEFLKV